MLGLLCACLYTVDVLRDGGGAFSAYFLHWLLYTSGVSLTECLYNTGLVHRGVWMGLNSSHGVNPCRSSKTGLTNARVQAV
jgi:hypothetical protein